jgi:hypothetical protein
MVAKSVCRLSVAVLKKTSHLVCAKNFYLHKLYFFAQMLVKWTRVVVEAQNKAYD